MEVVQDIVRNVLANGIGCLVILTAGAVGCYFMGSATARLRALECRASRPPVVPPPVPSGSPRLGE